MINRNNSKQEVGILIPTMNRPDFVIRQMNYYADLNFTGTVYYTDASNPENSKKIKDRINELRNKLKVVYRFDPPGDGVGALIKLLYSVEEKYVTFIGDDDYHVPNTLYNCAEFLENNPEYETAMGKSVTIRVKDNGAYGKVLSVHDYPRYSIELDTGSKRLFDHLVNHFNSIIAAVVSTEHLSKYFQDGSPIKDVGIKGELLPCSLMAIAGKLKILDQIGLVRQIHYRNFVLPDIFDQITGSDWPESYASLKTVLVSALIAKDGISPEIAEKTIKQCLWANLNSQLATYYPQYISLTSSPAPNKLRNKIGIRNKIAARFPVLKTAYRKLIRPLITDKQQLHYEVLRPNSKYYKDFQQIIKSVEK